jgi:hypothetical protein
MRKGLLAVALLGCAVAASADTIVVDGKTLEDVYVRQSDAVYYVQIPADGKVISVQKSAGVKVTLSTDNAQRDALLREWKTRNAANKSAPETASVPDALPDAPRVETDMSTANVRSRAAENGEKVGHVRLKNVPLRVALKAIARSKGLDYEVRDGHIFVSTPQRIRHEAAEPLDTRTYALGSVGSETLPKVVVSNPGGAANAGGMYGGYSGANGYGGGMRGGGMGGYGGGYGGMNGGGMQISNISQLFSTIDDRRVGETPAIIGVVGVD